MQSSFTNRHAARERKKRHRCHWALSRIFRSRSSVTVSLGNFLGAHRRHLAAKLVSGGNSDLQSKCLVLRNYPSDVSESKRMTFEDVRDLQVICQRLLAASMFWPVIQLLKHLEQAVICLLLLGFILIQGSFPCLNPT